ncbi:hypothetical protein [Telluribacter sp. SYSU D00476]|uniref:hypothetical protein n=1 Tax=Telluribacter sp. SYSU D00476 TaxID=2811430 RepID=UPI001FF22E57|nr:hypothetical protein [Telluribacter sp. SYSU D00476]
MPISESYQLPGRDGGNVAIEALSLHVNPGGIEGSYFPRSFTGGLEVTPVVCLMNTALRFY